MPQVSSPKRTRQQPWGAADGCNPGPLDLAGKGIPATGGRTELSCNAAT